MNLLFVPLTIGLPAIDESLDKLLVAMKQLVTSGSYDVAGADGKNEKHKVNLLNSSERYYIANEVVSRLEAINTDLFILAWQVRTLSWNDLWFSLDPEGWANVMSGKNIIGGIVAEWNQGYLLKW